MSTMHVLLSVSFPYINNLSLMCLLLICLFLDVPVFVSKPHFLDAKDYLVNVTGLKPIREIHDAFLNVEPVSSHVHVYTCTCTC